MIELRSTTVKELRTEVQRWVHYHSHLTEEIISKQQLQLMGQKIKGISLLSTVTTGKPKIETKLKNDGEKRWRGIED